MPEEYEITLPEGGTYRVSSPTPLTADAAEAMARQAAGFDVTPAPDQSWWQRNMPKTGDYVYGGKPGSKEGTDCSGAMCVIGKGAGVDLPRTAKAQFEDKRGKAVGKKDLKPGDLVFFGSPGPSGWHVGFYQGGGKFLHQSTDSKPGLSIGDLEKHSAKYGFRGAKRFNELSAKFGGPEQPTESDVVTKLRAAQSRGPMGANVSASVGASAGQPTGQPPLSDNLILKALEPQPAPAKAKPSQKPVGTVKDLVAQQALNERFRQGQELQAKAAELSKSPPTGRETGEEGVPLGPTGAFDARAKIDERLGSPLDRIAEAGGSAILGVMEQAIGRRIAELPQDRLAAKGIAGKGLPLATVAALTAGASTLTGVTLESALALALGYTPADVAGNVAGPGAMRLIGKAAAKLRNLLTSGTEVGEAVQKVANEFKLTPPQAAKLEDQIAGIPPKVETPSGLPPNLQPKPAAKPVVEAKGGDPNVLPYDLRGAGYNFYGDAADAVAKITGDEIKDLEIFSSTIGKLGTMRGVRLGSEGMDKLKAAGYKLEQKHPPEVDAMVAAKKGTPPTPPTPLKGAKEPWEMTAKDFVGDGANVQRRELESARAATDAARDSAATAGQGSIRSQVGIKGKAGLKANNAMDNARRNAQSNLESKAEVASGLARKVMLAEGKVKPRTAADHAFLRSLPDRVKAQSYIHRERIETALKEGKPVPAEVLADYPDLAAKYGSKPTVKENLTVPKVEELKVVPDSKIKEALKDASAERQSAFEALQKARAKQNAARKGRKQSGAAAPILPEEIAYAKTWLKEKGLQAASAVEDVVKHLVDLGFDGPHARRVAKSLADESPSGDATGLANQVQSRKAIAGIIDEVEPTKGKSADYWQKEGKKDVDSGAVDPDGLAERIASGEEELTGRKTGALLEGARRKENSLNAARQNLDSAIASGRDTSFEHGEYLKAKKAYDEYLAKVQVGKGRWSDVGRALQAGTELDTGNYAQVLKEFERGKGRKATEAEAEKLADAVKRATDAEAKVAKFEEAASKAKAESLAGKAPPGERGRVIAERARTNRVALFKEIDDILKGSAKTHSTLSTAYDAVKYVNAAGKIAITYIQEGVGTLDEAVSKVIADFASRGIEVTPQQIYDDIDGMSKTRTRSELEKGIAEQRKLVSEAKRNSTRAKAAKDEKAQIKYADDLFKAEQEIDDAMDQLKTGKYRKPETKERLAHADLERARRERDILKNDIRRRIEEAKLSVGRKIGREIGAIPRALQATGEASAVLRQGLLLAAGNPGKAAAARATVDPNYAAKVAREINDSPMNHAHVRSKLYIAPIEGATGPREETFFSNWVNRIPLVGIVTKAAERHYTTYLNVLRTSVFDATYHAVGDMTDDEAKALASFINVASGRGELGKFGAVADDLATAFFSPRFMASRIQAPMHALGLTKGGKAIWRSRGARRQQIQSWTSLLGVGMTALYAAKSAGAEVTLDPESPDFGKIKMGNTSVDLWAGFQQPVRLFAKIVKRAYQRSQGEDPKARLNTIQEISQFLNYKTAPALNLASEILSGKDAIGKDISAQDALVKSAIPLFYQDLLEMLKDENIPDNSKAAIAGLGFFGTGIQTYDRSKKSSGSTKMEMPKAKKSGSEMKLPVGILK